MKLQTIKMKRSDQSKVSVIVPVYNAESTIKKCIRSILAQTYKNFELILVDDGSEDNSSNICNKYKYDTRVKAFRIQNHGAAYARNFALNHSMGEYLMFCDADDYYAEDYIYQMVRTIQLTKADIVISGYFFEKNQRFHSSVKMKSKSLSKNEIIKHMTIDTDLGGFPWNKIFRRTIINNLRFPEDLLIMEDAYFFLGAMQNTENIYYLAKPLYYYCNNSNSITKKIENIYSSNNTNQYLSSWEKILNNFIFDKKSKKYIYAAMYKIAVDAKFSIMHEQIKMKTQLLSNLDVYLKRYWKYYFLCTDITYINKIKTIIKVLF